MDGLRFECQPGCTACCEVEGQVHLTENDLLRIAEYVGLPAGEFERKYVFRTRNILRLRKPRHAQCYFLKDGGCSVHPVKPVQCRLFPFWPELVEQKAAWNKAAKTCPGIHKGPLVQISAAREIAAEMRSAYPVLYR